MAALDDETMHAITVPAFTAINRSVTPPSKSIPNSELEDNHYPDIPHSSQSAFEKSCHDVNVNPSGRRSLEELETPLAQSIESDDDGPHASSEAGSSSSPSYSYQVVLGEAEEMYEGEKPPFCILTKKKEKHKAVIDFQTGKDVDMEYKQWLDTKYGY